MQQKPPVFFKKVSITKDMKFSKKWLKFTTISCVSMLAMSTYAWAEETEGPTDTISITETAFPMYDYADEPFAEAYLYFIDGQNDIPYVTINGLVDLLTYSCAMQREQPFTAEIDDGVVQITAWNGYSCIIDLDSDEISFDDYNAFFQKDSAATILDMTSPLFDNDGNPLYLAPTTFAFERYGKAINIDLSNYNIDLVHTEAGNLLPLQTVNDLFLMPYSTKVLFNGEAAFFVWGDGLPETPMADIYYSVEPCERSQELAEFNYLELCLALDLFYGLKEVHDIEYFDKLFKETGLFEPLLSTDPLEYSQALMELTQAYFGDLHSIFTAPSFYAGAEIDSYAGMESLTMVQDEFIGELFSSTRDSYFPDSVPYYEEYGNTAYVTFDRFSFNENIHYYDDGLPEDPGEWDTRGIIIYANSQIKREDSPIENVVLDLSLNGGGTIDTALYVISWFLGDANLNIEDTMTGAQVTTNYMADINLDGEFDLSDSLIDYNLYCLVSPYSFSCGNLVPYSFKNSGTVSLIGSRTEGGACAVLHMSSADGSLFDISSNNRISVVKNGSFYNVDEGTDVDFSIDKVWHYYDREALTDYINGLF